MEVREFILCPILCIFKDYIAIKSNRQYVYFSQSKYRLYYLMLFVAAAGKAHCQEAAVNDLKSCEAPRFATQDLIKQLSKAKDSSRWFHNDEIVVFYNEKGTKYLDPSSLYIFNHGPNKLISLRILKINCEFSSNKKEKFLFSTDPSGFIQVFYQDSFPRCGMGSCKLVINKSYFKKIKITGLLLEIKYYDKTINRSFINTYDENKSIQIRTKEQFAISFPVSPRLLFP